MMALRAKSGPVTALKPYRRRVREAILAERSAVHGKWNRRWIRVALLIVGVVGPAGCIIEPVPPVYPVRVWVPGYWAPAPMGHIWIAGHWRIR
jgi:hypothetical protein